LRGKCNCALGVQYMHILFYSCKLQQHNTLAQHISSSTACGRRGCWRRHPVSTRCCYQHADGASVPAPGCRPNRFLNPCTSRDLNPPLPTFMSLVTVAVRSSPSQSRLRGMQKLADMPGKRSITAAACCWCCSKRWKRVWSEQRQQRRA
jgi:hypothetical protein